MRLGLPFLALLCGCATLGIRPTPDAGAPPAEAPQPETPRAGPDADVAAAVAKLGHGETAAARRLVQRHATAAGDPAAAFVLGVAESRLGNGAHALALLQPFAGSGP